MSNHFSQSKNPKNNLLRNALLEFLNTQQVFDHFDNNGAFNVQIWSVKQLVIVAILFERMHQRSPVVRGLKLQAVKNRFKNSCNYLSF
jgi:hypothetical protein